MFLYCQVLVRIISVLLTAYFHLSSVLVDLFDKIQAKANSYLNPMNSNIDFHISLSLNGPTEGSKIQRRGKQI
jgi:hypothetical protein